MPCDPSDSDPGDPVNLRNLSRLSPILFLLHSGCSWAFMHRAPQTVEAPNYPVECTSSRAAPALDTICAGYFVVNGLVLATRTSCDQASPGQSCVESGTKTGGILLSAGLATLCAVSAGTGYGNANRCEAVKSANALCITGNEAACRQLNPRWSPPLKLPAAESAPGPAPTPLPAPSRAAVAARG